MITFIWEPTIEKKERRNFVKTITFTMELVTLNE